MKFLKNLRYQRGFSILEFCVCLMILALFVSGLNYFYTRTLEEAKTQALIKKIENVMLDTLYFQDQEDLNSTPQKRKLSLIEGEASPKAPVDINNDAALVSNGSIPEGKECPGGGEVFVRRKMHKKEGLWICVEGSQLKKTSLEKIGHKMKREFYVLPYTKPFGKNEPESADPLPEKGFSLSIRVDS